MTEIEKLRRAKNIVDKMVLGINPVTNEKMPAHECVCNDRVNACLMYLSGILEKVLATGNFFCNEKIYVNTNTVPSEELSKLVPFDEEVGITTLVKRINSTLSDDTKPITIIRISNWLLDKGYLEWQVIGGEKKKICSTRGEEIGIISRDFISLAGKKYKKNLYSKAAQLFIFAHINDILVHRKLN